MPNSSYMVAVATIRTRRTFFRRVDDARSVRAAARIACKRVYRQQRERCTVEHIAAIPN
jgi:hypothetical protein